MTQATQVHVPCRPNLSASPAFAIRVQQGLRSFADKRRVAPAGFPLSEAQARLAAGIDALAAHIGASDPEDPRMVALMYAARATSTPEVWEPGAEQSRVLSGIGRTILGAERASAHDLDAIYTELVAAGVEDVYAIMSVKLAIVEGERDRLRAERDELRPKANRTERAELELIERTSQHQVDVATLARKARLDAVAATVPDAVALVGPEPRVLPNHGPELPTGVRKHGKGFQAYRREGGKQKAKTFATIPEALAWREEVQEVAA